MDGTSLLLGRDRPIQCGGQERTQKVLVSRGQRACEGITSRVPWLSVSFNRHGECLPRTLPDRENPENRTTASSSLHGRRPTWAVPTTSVQRKRCVMFSFSCAALFQMESTWGFPGVWRRVCVGGNATAKATIQPHCLIRCELRPQIFNTTTEIFTVGQFSWREASGILTVHAISEGPGWAAGKRQ
uniref:Uncharacterized protein n=1 Tax=Myotis myotis TaxID=51298 RepID=A0A7J7WHF0_MYOMY|nr:hypothetical protein mMyoMyo1_012025 [Myotis myotis]